MSRRDRLFIVSAFLPLFLAGGAVADVNLCLYNGTASLHYQCYETELNCDDINLGLIIRECEDLSVAPGGGGASGSGVVTDLHPEVNGQSVLGRPNFTGDAVGPTGPLSDFVVLWETRDTFEPGRRVQAVARDASGALYRTEFDVAGLDRRDVGDFCVTGTPAGEEVLGAFDLEPSGRIAGGDMTVSIFVVSANDPPAKAVLEVHHTDVDFSSLTWSYLSSGPVSNQTLGFGALKAIYR